MRGTCSNYLKPIEFIQCQELPGRDFMMSEIIKEYVKMEENLLTKVMTEFLNREPLYEDFKECTRITYPHFEMNDYLFAYKDKILGFVKHQYGPKLSVTFTPDAGTY
jgi:hypothetical protein